MDIQLLRMLGNMDQLAGIRESEISSGRSKGLRIAEFYNAAGLRFTVCPDRCMDILDMSYKGLNLSFQTKNGFLAPAYTSERPAAFGNQWSGGLLYTCGLDNVGGGSDEKTLGTVPTHGRIAHIPAEHYGADCRWEGEDYLLSARGDMHQTNMHFKNLVLHREISTGLYGKSLVLRDRLDNLEPTDEPFMLLYHVNFGYPLLTPACRVFTTSSEVRPRNDFCTDHVNMMEPVDGRPEEFFLHVMETEEARAALINPQLQLGTYVKFRTENLPYLGEWKNMCSHEYVLALEPCNCAGNGRLQELAENTILRIPGYSSLEYEVEIGVLDGAGEIAAFTGE